MVAVTLDKNKKYKYDKGGDLVEATVIADTDIIMAGSKSSLRRIADLERNVSILATTLTTTDGAATDASDATFATTVVAATRFKSTVRMDGTADHYATIQMNSNKIVDLGTPSIATDAANKSYVDTAVTNGLNSKDPVITLSGDATGSVTLANLGSGTLSVAIVDDSHNHIISNVDGLQAALDDKLASANSYTNTAISNLVNGASAAFDTLSEIQNAMATDSELSAAIAAITTVANANQLSTARTISLSGDATGSISFNGTANVTIPVVVADDSHNHIISNVDGLQAALDDKLASASYTAADVLAKIKIVDGAGSGLDADLLDGQSSAYYATAASVTAEASTRNALISALQARCTALEAKLAAFTAVSGGVRVAGTITATGDVTAFGA